MDKEKLADLCLVSLNAMTDIIDIILDNDTYPDKESAYDAIENICIERKFVER